jgi:putative membrane protein
MLWIKSFHIVFVASWFAGLFYLPRIFVNLAMVEAGSIAEQARLMLMAKKLLRFTTLLMIPALGLGVWLLWVEGFLSPGGGFATQGWLHAKLFLVALTLLYHFGCARHLRCFEQGQTLHSHIWYRWFNEIPVLLLTATVVLVVVKPF